MPTIPTNCNLSWVSNSDVIDMILGILPDVNCIHFTLLQKLCSAAVYIDKIKDIALYDSVCLLFSHPKT